MKPSYSTSIQGPGQFNIPVLPNMPTPPSYTISPRPKKESWMLTVDTPSPLDYSPRFDSPGPKYTIRNGSLDENSRLPVSSPGPADYLHRPKDTKYAYIHGTSYEPKTTLTPGPGKYNIETAFAKGARQCAIRPLVRRSTETINCAPYYNPKDTEFTKIKGLTIPKSARPEKSYHTASPGPAAYSPTTFKRITGHKLPPRPTKEQLEKEAEKQRKKALESSPGPASYNIMWTAIDKNSPAFEFYG